MTDSGAMVIKWIVQSSWTMTGRESVDLTGGVGVDDNGDPVISNPYFYSKNRVRNLIPNRNYLNFEGV